MESAGLLSSGPLRNDNLTLSSFGTKQEHNADSAMMNQHGIFQPGFSNQNMGMPYGNPGILANGNPAYRDELLRNSRVSFSQFAYLHQDNSLGAYNKPCTTNTTTAYPVQENLDQSIYR